MEEERKYGIMVLSLMVIGMKVKCKVEENFYIRMEKFMMVNLFLIRLMVMDSL